MSWEVGFRPEVEEDITDAAQWYEERESGLGSEFVEEIIKVWDALRVNPLLRSRRMKTKNVRWRYPERFPYRIVYKVEPETNFVLVVAVLHAARQDGAWRART